MTGDDLGLIDRYLDGELNEADRARLQVRLAGDPAFASAFTAEVRWQGLVASVLSCKASMAAGDQGGMALAERIEGIIANATGSASLRMVQAVEQRLRDNRTLPLTRIQRGPRALRRPTRHHVPRRAFPLWWSMGLAALLAITAGAWYLHTAAPVPAGQPTAPGETPATAELPMLAVLDSLSGDVHASDASSSNASLLTAHTGDELHDHQRVITGSDSQAVLRYDDGSTITIAAGSDLTISAEQGAKRLLLGAGALVGHIAKQPHDHPLILRTPQAQAEVVGTVFTLSASVARSRLEVTSGSVAFSSTQHPAQALLVAAGTAAMVNQGDGEAQPAPISGSVTSGELWDAAEGLIPVIEPTAEEDAWRQLPWFIDIHQARARALSSHLPLLVWLVWGSPLGMTTAESLQTRSNALGDASVCTALSTRCVMLVVDGWYLRRRTDADSLFIAHAVHQTKRAGRTKEGFLVVGEDGQLIGDCPCDCSPADLLQMLDALPTAPRAVLPLPSTDEQPSPPAGALLLSITTRALDHDASGYHHASGLDPAFAAPSHDALWLTQPEWRALLPTAPVSGMVMPLSPAVVAKIAEQALLDGTRGEAYIWDPTSLAQAQMDLLVDQVDDSHWTMRLKGHVLLEQGPRGLDAQLVGWMTYQASTQTITRLDLLVLGSRWGDEPKAVPARTGRTPLGIMMRLDASRLAALIPPHAARDHAYFEVPGVDVP